MELISTVFYFLVTIGILVFIHELGHFLAAKAFGMRVERFSVGFPPRAFGKKVGDTDYCVSWIPIGGYVKISGMIDESLDLDHLKREPEPWEFRAKPVWQRMIVMIAGVAMNLFLAIGIVWGILYVQGKTVRPVTHIGYVIPGSAAESGGFRVGDRILSINGTTMEVWDQIESYIYVDAMGEDLRFRIFREGAESDLLVSRASIPSLTEARFGIFPYGLAPLVAGIESGAPAEAIGLQPRDVIVAVNGTPVEYNGLSPTIRSFAGQEITLEWRRGDELLSARVTPTTEGRIGISLLPLYVGPVERRTFSMAGAFTEGVTDLVGMTGAFVKNVQAIIVGT
ncbi:MAG: RIP metalloprotease RseP, partial [Bacteroidota bacterium]